MDPRGHNSDRRRHSRRDGAERAAFASVARGRNTVTELGPYHGTQPVPSSGLCGSRFHTRTTHALASSRSQSEDESPEKTGPPAGVTVGLLTTFLAFNETHEHRLSAVQPPRIESVRPKTYRQLASAFAQASLARPWQTEPQSLSSWPREAANTFFAGGVGLAPFASGAWDKSFVLGLPATCYRASSMNLRGRLPIHRRLTSPHAFPRGGAPGVSGLGPRESRALPPPRRGRHTCAQGAFHDRCGDPDECQAAGPFASTHCLIWRPSPGLSTG